LSTREDVLLGFSADCEYSHVLPFRIENYVDGQFHLAMLCGAAHLAGDDLVRELAADWLTILPHRCRNWAARPVPGWDRGPGIWTKRGEQSFAGPAAYTWAHKCGVALPDPEVDISGVAGALRLIGGVYGALVRFVKPLRQHISSVMLSYLLADRTPPSTLRFTARNNPLYAYQFGVVRKWQYPTDSSPWPAKMVWGQREKPIRYTPTCQLTADMLQSTLTG